MTAILAPVLRVWVTRRMRQAGVSDVRIGERFGDATEARPAGKLIWFHAVSVGEALSVLGLIRTLGERDPGLQFLVTSVSATSARLVAERMPPRTRHQFAPIDTPRASMRFLDCWRPDLAVFVESELWPRLIFETAARGIPLALVNARLSARSRARWNRVPGLIRPVLGCFSVIVTQIEETAAALAALGADPERISTSGDLKAASDPLPVDEAAVSDLRKVLGGRAVWVAASTHPGEEAIIVRAHQQGLLILAPRHPERGGEVAGMLKDAGLKIAQRSRGEVPGPETDVYLADTLGELGLWYSLTDLVFLGGSFTPVGGHNPFEPAQMGVGVLHGPHVTNFRDTYAAMSAAGAAREVGDADELATALAELGDPERRAKMKAAAQAFASERETIRDHVADRLMPLLAEQHA